MRAMVGTVKSISSPFKSCGQALRSPHSILALKLLCAAAVGFWLSSIVNAPAEPGYQPAPRTYACDGSERICNERGTVAGPTGEPVSCTLQWMGGLSDSSLYGEWPLCMHDMAGATIMSFGVGRDASFEMSMLKHARVAAVHAYDPTLADEDINLVKPYFVPGFNIHRKGLGIEAGTSTFMKPVAGFASFGSNPGMAKSTHLRKGKDGKPVTVSLPVDTIHGLAALEHAKWVPLVKADVEGEEFIYFSNPTLVAALPASQVILEFHDRLLPDGEKQRAAVVDTFKASGWIVQLETSEQAVFLKQPTA